MDDSEPAIQSEVNEAQSSNVDVVPETGNTAKPNFSLLANRSSSTDSDKEACTVHVVTRVRPLNPQEVNRRDKISIQFPGEGAVLVDSQGKETSFRFHGVFEPGCVQSQIFKNSGIKHLLDMALNGYACTAFAFGQTGSGKTYTMTGPVTPEDTKPTQERTLRDIDSYGLIQYSFAYLMECVAEKQNTAYAIRASYLEIYNEQVQDLLNPIAYEGVQVRWSKSLGFYVENLFVREIDALDDLLNVLEDGMRNRAVAEHNINEHSSRSHSVLTVYLDSEIVSEGMAVTKHGKVSFVDLAGSEKVKDTGSTGDTLIEATNINRSLLTLGNCISALSDPKKRGGHIPFRDSKLTKLLADGLGGSGITLMIACVTPSSYNLSETLNTLRYAKRAKKIKNKPVIRIDPREELILKLQREMNLLKQENRFLRHQLEFPHRDKPRFPHPNTADVLQKRYSREPALPAIKSDQSIENKAFSPGEKSVSDNSLYEMLQEYMVENEALRNENQTLITQHSVDEREQRIVSGENDKLARKLEDLSRLMLSSPLYTSTYFSRTNSGRSENSFNTFSSSITPLSQNAFIQNKQMRQLSKIQNGHTPANSYPNVARIPNGPMMAWITSPNNPHYRTAGGLPPLRNSPNAVKERSRIERVNPRGQPAAVLPSKLLKGSTYASQFKRKQDLHRPPEDSKSQKPSNDVMRDFPMRDYGLTKARMNEAFYSTPRDVYTEEESRQKSSPRDTNHVNHLMSSFPSYYNKPNFSQVPFKGAGGALPVEAYKPQDISPRNSKTKELSATSLRKLNNRMRQEMQALDDEIDSYRKAMHNQPKKKIPAT